MHWRHWMSKLTDFLHAGPHFWILADEIRGTITTTHTIPGKGQFHWITSPMGLLGSPASFHRLMEGVLLNLQNIIIYIDDILVHSDTDEKHLQILEQVLD
jgi:hypothetical protein